MKVLAGDIGGTKTTLAIFDVSGPRPVSLQEETYRSAGFDSLESIVSTFLGGVSGDCAHACFGIAGPVSANTAKTTNLPWFIDGDRMAASLDLNSVSLINDLEANAWGIAALTPTDFFELSPGAPGATGNAAVISAGTGLGEAGMYWDGERHRPFGTEGGHADFSPQTKRETELLLFLKTRYEHVSWERLVCGGGLVNIYEFMLSRRGAEPPPAVRDAMREGDPAAAISKAALSGECEHCADALDLFVHLYGAEAGNLALKMMATGGVYVGGGIAPKILERLKAPGFMQAFHAKGRMESLMRGMPVRVILNPRTALLGPALFVLAARS